MAERAEAVEACAHWCDVVGFNLYQRSIVNDCEEWAHFHALGKPALIGDFHFGSTDRGLFWEGLIGAGAERERGSAPYAPQSSHTRISRLQLAFELVEETPISAFGNDFLRARPDQ
jgi:hypothetical protein